MSDANDFLDRVNRSGQNHAGVEQYGPEEVKANFDLYGPKCAQKRWTNWTPRSDRSRRWATARVSSGNMRPSNAFDVSWVPSTKL